MVEMGDHIAPCRHFDFSFSAALIPYPPGVYVAKWRHPVGTRVGPH